MLDNQYDEKYYKFPREHTGSGLHKHARPVTGWGVYLLRVATFVLSAIVAVMMTKAVL